MLKEKEIHIPNEFYAKHATVYSDTNVTPKACILYFHGGGLLYGTRTDLPRLHLEMLTDAGYSIIAFDYPLAPSAKLDLILEDICASILHYIETPSLYIEETETTRRKSNTPNTDRACLPFFLWGRSAGAYLCLLAAASGKLTKKPSGILSYYGYGFLCDGWFMTPSSYYRTLPAVDDTVLGSIPAGIHADGDLNTHYGVYVYARQNGT